MSQEALTEYISRFIYPDDVVVDLGCGDKRYSDPFKQTCHIVTVDAWKDVEPDIVADVEKESFPFAPNSVDVIMMLDFVEHLDKEAGLLILEEAKKSVRHTIILLTPLIWSDNKHNVNNPKLWCFGNEHDVHKSLWSADDFTDPGWLKCTEELWPGSLERYYIGTWSR